MLFGPSKLEHMRSRSPINYQRLGKGHSQVSQHVLGGPIFDAYQIWHVPDKVKPKLTGHIYQLGSFLKWIQGPSISNLIVHILKTKKVWGVGFGQVVFFFLNRFWTCLVTTYQQVTNGTHSHSHCCFFEVNRQKTFIQ